MFDFPTTPAVGEKFPTPPVPGSPTYVWDGTKWMASGAPAGVATLIVSDTPPPSPSPGTLWWDSTAGLLYLFYVDPSGPPGQWVPAVPQPDFTLVNSAFVQKTGDTMSGDLTINKQTPYFNLSKTDPASGEAALWGLVNGVRRWKLGLTSGDPETGSATGSNFHISARNDDGSARSVPLNIARDTGLAVIAGDPTAALGVATKQYVDNSAGLAAAGMQINGSVEVSQELGSAGVLATAGAGKYAADGWIVSSSGVQVSTGVQTTGPFWFKNAIQNWIATGNPSPGAGDYCNIIHAIEGYRISRLGWGTVSAKPLTVAFWITAVRPGTYSGSIRNGPVNRSYTFSFTLSVSNAWEYKTITIPGDTAGTWGNANGKEMIITFSMMSGSSFNTAAGVWTAGNFMGVPGTINGVAANTDGMFVTGLVVLPGALNLTAAQSPLIMRPYDQELQLCQRYYRKSYNPTNAPGFAPGAGSCSITGSGSASAAIVVNTPFNPIMRANPILKIYDGAGASNFVSTFTSSWVNGGAITVSAATQTSSFVQVSTGVSYINFEYTADARL